MTDFNSDEGIKNLLKSACTPVSAPPELRERLSARLTLAAGSVNDGKAFYERPKILVPLLVAITSGLIGYGVWLSLNVAPTLLP